MTHTLHRLGDRESLKKDYVILAMASRPFNMKGAAPKFGEIARICAKHNPVNLGDLYKEDQSCSARGASFEQIIKSVSDKTILHAVYTDKEAVKEVLKELKEADLGISIVVSGVFDEIFGICKEASIEGPFTVNVSLGIMGKTELLPDKEVLEITTMCGHHMVSQYLTEKLIEKVQKHEVTSEEAAKELAKQCMCGAFNTRRAAELIKNLAQQRNT